MRLIKMEKLIKIFKALGDKNRFRIVKMLQQRSLCVCEITAVLELATSTVSKHLSLLKEAEIITEAREHVRGLIEKIVLTPTQSRKELSVDLYGDLAGILRIASKGNSMESAAQKSRRPVKNVVNDNLLNEPSIQVVAGKGFEPMTFGL